MNSTDLGYTGVVLVDHLSDIRDYSSNSKPTSHDKGTFVAVDALADPVRPRNIAWPFNLKKPAQFYSNPMVNCLALQLTNTTGTFVIAELSRRINM